VRGSEGGEQQREEADVDFEHEFGNTNVLYIDLYSLVLYVDLYCLVLKYD
jgi:hypothetical protein